MASVLLYMVEHPEQHARGWQTLRCMRQAHGQDPTLEVRRLEDLSLNLC